jgi:hypothetical protein
MQISSMRIYVRRLVDDNNTSSTGRWTDQQIDDTIVRTADVVAKALARGGAEDLVLHDTTDVVDGVIDLSTLTPAASQILAVSMSHGRQIIPIRKGGMGDEVTIAAMSGSVSVSYIGQTYTYVDGGVTYVAPGGIENIDDATYEQAIAYGSAIELKMTEGEAPKILVDYYTKIRDDLMTVYGGSSIQSRTPRMRIRNHVPIWTHARWRHRGLGEVIIYV